MNRASFVLASVCAVATLAQTPRTAPTAADWTALSKLPDFTGVWETPLGGGGGGNAGAGRGAAPAGAPAGAPGGRGAAPAAGDNAGRGGAPPAAAGGGRAGGGGGRGRGGAAAPQLTPEYAAKAKNPTPVEQSGSQATNCLPPGLPGIMTQPYPYEFLMTPGQVTIISEAYGQVRRVYTDGRKLSDDPDPNFFGQSRGKWEGDTLVVETTGLAQVPRGLNFPYSEKLKITERFHLTDPDTMVIETTATDADALAAPYTMAQRTLRRHRSWTVQEYICEENNRNFVDAGGKEGVKLANPLSSAK